MQLGVILMITSSCKNIQVKLISKCSLKKEELIMEANNSFTRDLAKQLLPYLFHHDPNMEDTELSNKNEGV